MTSTSSSIPADTKDWTVVLRQGCEQCGFTPDFPYSEVSERLQALIPAVTEIFERPTEELVSRPDATTWAPVEYLAHSAEVCEVMMDRLQLMLVQDNPQFPSWDQDAAAVDGAYLERPLGHVKRDVLTNLQHASTEFEKVPADLLSRAGTRGDGGKFTIRTLAEYFVHDVEHHVFFDLVAER
mgnify:CR=1 FL=1